MASESVHDHADRFAEFRDRLEINKRFYRDEDPSNGTLAVFAEAALSALNENYFQSMISDMFDARPNLKIPTAVKLLERVYQADLLQHDAEYPHGYQQAEAWIREFEAVDEDMVRWGVAWQNLRSRNLQSNIAERYKTVKLLGALLLERFDKPPSHLDVGSSVMHGSVKLIYNRTGPNRLVPFKHMEITESPQPSRAGNRMVKNRHLSRIANEILAKEVPIGEAMGIDLTDVDDPVTKQWAKSCSFYPDELFDSQKVAEYDLLDRLDPNHERIRAFRGDFSRFDFKKFLDESPVPSYDIITFSTVFYQVSQQERNAMLVNAAQLLSKNGIIIIQDGVNGDFSKRYNYVTSVIDSSERNPSEQTLLKWETPRCGRAALGMGRISIGGKLQTIKQALERYDG